MNWHQVGTFPVFGGQHLVGHPHRTGPHRRHRPGRGPGDDPGVGPDYPGSGGSRARQRTRRGSDGLAPRRFLHRPVGRPAAVRPNWPSATQLVPDLQRPLAVGDGILDGPPGAAWFRGGAGPPAAAAGVALQQFRARRLAGATGRLDRLLVDVDVRVGRHCEGGTRLLRILGTDRAVVAERRLPRRARPGRRRPGRQHVGRRPPPSRSPRRRRTTRPMVAASSPAAARPKGHRLDLLRRLLTTASWAG